MKRIVLKGTELDVSQVGFGTASLHHSLLYSQRQKLVKKALDIGISHFDTARMYGNGISEVTLGKILSGSARRDVTIATKVGFEVSSLQKSFPLLCHVSGKLSQNHILRPVNYSVQALDRSFTDSLRALKTSWVDILFLHEPILADHGNLLLALSWLQKQKKLGKARYIGLAGERLFDLPRYKDYSEGFDVFQTSSQCLTSVEKYSLRPQIQYGYFSKLRQKHPSHIFERSDLSACDGMVLYSTRKIRRIEELARALSISAE